MLTLACALLASLAAQQDAILGLVDSFMNKSGKFAIPGYPRKLGFLLHGPPGTGKTSMIRGGCAPALLLQ